MIQIYLQKPKKRLPWIDSPPRSSPKPGHPWEMDVIFDPSAKCWKLSIEPGFINAMDPRFPRAESEYLAKQKQGSGTSRPVYNNSGRLLSGVEIGIMDADPVTINAGDWKDINEPPIGAPSNPDVIPAFFKQVYKITPPPVISESQINAALQGNANSLITTLSDITPPSRLLYKCDVWIEQARTTYTVNADIPGNLVTGDLVDYRVDIDSSSLLLGNRPKVVIGPIIPTKTIFPKIGQTNFAYIDSKGNQLGIDFLQIGTIYWLSPDRTTSKLKVSSPNDVSDEGFATWTVFTRHDLFFNLSYYKKNVIPFNLQQQTLDPFLAWFVGRYSFAPAATIGAAGALEQEIINNISNQVDQSGMFWTT